MCCCCCTCWECSCCCDAFFSGPVTACLSPEPFTCAPINGSPVCAVTTVGDLPLSPPPGSNGLMCYSPGTAGFCTGDPCSIPCSPHTHGATCNAINPCGPKLSAPGAGSGSSGGKQNQPATNQNLTALSNTLSTLGKAVAGALSLQSATAPINTNQKLATSPTSLGIIAIVVLLGALLLAMSFGER